MSSIEPTAQETGATYTLISPQGDSLARSTPSLGSGYDQWAIVADANITGEAVALGTTEWSGKASSGFVKVSGTKDANTTSRNLRAATAATASTLYRVTTGQTYQLSIQARGGPAAASASVASTPDDGVYVSIFWYDSGANLLSQSDSATSVLAANEVATLTVEANAPASAVYGRAAITGVTNFNAQIIEYYYTNVSLRRVVKAVFNDPASSDYICGLSGEEAVTGLDSPDVRESFADLTEADGAIHGNFYHGRRPITMRGTIVEASNTARAEKMSKLSHAANAMREDAELRWTPTDSIEQFVRIRKQQPLRFTGGGNAKEFFAAFVAADPIIYGTTLRSHLGISAATTATQECTNRGTAASPFELIRIRRASGTITAVEVRLGGSVGPVVVALSGLSLGAGPPVGQIEVDVRNRTVYDQAGASAYSKVDFATTEWSYLPIGSSDVYIAATGGNVTVDLYYRDAWI